MFDVIWAFVAAVTVWVDGIMVIIFTVGFLSVSAYIALTLLDLQLYTDQVKMLSIRSFGERNLCTLITLSARGSICKTLKFHNLLPSRAKT